MKEWFAVKTSVIVLDSSNMFWGWALLLDALSKLTFGNLVIHKTTAPGEVVRRCRDAKATWILVNKTKITGRTLRALSGQITDIFVMATGYSNIDIDVAKELGIRIWNVAGYANDSVAEYVMAAIGDRCRLLSEHRQAVENGDWARAGQFSHTLGEPTLMKGKTLGIIGLGRIGKAVARIAMAYGIKVIAHDKHQGEDWFEPMKNVKMVKLATLYKESDFISIHANLEEDGYGMIDDAALRMMKATAILINAARGEFINYHDLIHALQVKEIAWAVLDVLPWEPPTTDKAKNIVRALLETGRCKISTHQAWLTKVSMLALIRGIIANMRACSRKEHEGAVVNPAA